MYTSVHQVNICLCGMEKTAETPGLGHAVALILLLTLAQPWPSATTASIEVRICTDEEASDENVYIQYMELYIQ